MYYAIDERGEVWGSGPDLAFAIRVARRERTATGRGMRVVRVDPEPLPPDAAHRWRTIAPLPEIEIARFPGRRR